MKELEALVDELGNMYDELVARTLSHNVIIEDYRKLSYSELCNKMIDTINEIRKG